MAKAAFRLPISDTVISSWQKINGTKTTFWYCFVAFFIVILLHNTLLKYSPSIHPGLIFALGVIIFLAYVLLYAGIYYLGIQRAKGNNITPFMALNVLEPHRLLNLFGLVIVQTLIVLIPSLLIFAGMQLTIHPLFLMSFLGYVITIGSTLAFIIILVRLSLGIAFVLDLNEKPVSAVIHSYEATKGNFFRLIGFYYILMVLITAGLLTFVIGVIWTLPLFFIAYGNMYHQLADKNL